MFKNCKFFRPAVAAILFLAAAAGQAQAWRGQQKWVYDAQNNVTGTPVTAQGKVIIGDSEGRLLALDMNSGEPVWTFEAGGPINGAPALSGQTLYAGGMDGALSAVDIETGSLMWQFNPSEKFTPGSI
jgi:outer membrane protein assembly factor BamB